MSKSALQRRLLEVSPGRGRRSPTDTRLRLTDVSTFIGVRRSTLSLVAHRRQELDDALQMQLSSFFTLWERGCIVKEVRGDHCELRRVPRPAGEPEPPRATIDVSGLMPRVDWNWKHHP